MRKGTLTVKLKFKVLPDGLSGQSVAGEPVFPASIAQGNTFEVDISPICDTRKAEVKYSLVSNSLESVTDTAKIYIPASLDAYNVAFKRKLVQSIIYCATERERVWATIDYEATRLFTGIVDLSNLTIQSYSYQGDIELTLKDNGYLLDEKIAQSIELPVQAFPRFNSASSPKTKGVYYKDPDNANAFYFWNGSAWAHKESFSDTESKYFHPDATVRVWSSAVVGGELVESVVGALLGMAGYSVSGGTIDPSASDTSTSVVRCFTYDMSEDKTYKEVLDTLLKEYRMCLTFTPEGKVRIVSLSHTSIHATRDIGYGLKGTLGRRDGIKTTFEASKKDGVKLKYSSGLAVRREQSIYSENLGSEFDENGELKGTAIKPQQCLPETGDITATYQEFNAKFLDRAYTTKVNRKENEDLSIISTHGHHLEVAQKGGTLTYPAFTVGESAEHGTGANPYFMPKKAQVLFRNDYEMKNKDPDSTEYEKEAESHSIYLQIFNIVADVLYRDKTTTIYAPSATANPETYESTYLFEDGPARAFANFYLGWNQYGAMKTDWTEYKGTVDTIGSIIGYQHTDSAISSYCLLSEETISFTGSPDVPFVIKMHGIGIAPYNDKPVQSVSYMGDNKNRGANGATGPKGETGATGTSIIGIVEEYALSSSSSSVTGSWGTAVPTLSPTDKYLWNRSKTMYSDGTSSAYTTAVVIGVYGDTGKTGATGAQGPSPALLSIDTDTVYVNAYSDGPAKGFEGAEVNASVTVGGVKQEGWAFSVSGATKVTVSVDATLGKYTVTAIDDNARSGSFVVVASKDGKTLYAQAYVQKMYEIGTVLAEASGSVFGYYADNVPHNATESIEVTVTLAGYSPSYAPRCTLGAEDVTLANGKYVITADDVKSRDYVTFSAIGIHNTSSITVRKVLDVASLSLSVDKTSFGYYADGTAHSGEGACTITIVASGMSCPPTLKVAGKAKALTASAPKYTASVTNADLVAGNAPTKVEATYGSLSRTETLVKVFDQPTITLVLSKDTFGYYADNVAHEEETGITASVSYRGLYEKPLLSVGGVQTALGKDNTCVIPPSAVADKDSVAVEAYSAHIDTNTLLASRFIFKVKDQPSISLVASATQFHQAGDGTVAPDEIVVTPKVSGLSPSAGITYEFGGSAVSLTDGAYVVGKDAVETYKTMTTTWNGKLYDSLTILKTVDGKAMTYMYASAPEGLYPGGYPFGTDQNVIGMADTAIGINYEWHDTVPDIADGYVLWTKTTAPDGTVSIYRVQGPKGEPGETGPQGPQGPKGESEGTYLGTGTSTTIPTKRPDGSDIAEGDFYLDISNTENPIPYEMKNDKWTAVDGSSAKWSVVASAIQGDVAKYCPNISNSNGLYGFFKNLSAVNGYIDGLGTRSLALTSGGELKSEEWDTSGGTEGFYLPSDGNAVFNTGTFQGGIANGWTIFGGLQMEIPATMTQKELYSALRKAGVGSGAYMGVGPLANAELFNEEKAYSTKNMLKGFTQRFTHVVCSENLVSLQPLVSLGPLVTTVGKGYFLTMEHEEGSSSGEYTYTVRLLSPSDVDTLSGIGILHKTDSLVDNNGGGSVGTDVTSTFAYESNAAVPVTFPHAYWHDPDNNKSYGLSVSKVYIFDSSSGSMVITSHDIICYDTDGSTVISGASAENTIISWYDSQHIRRCTWGGKTVWLYTFEDGTGATNHAWIAYSEDMVHWTRISGTTITKAVVVSDTETQTTGYTCPLAYNGILYYFRITCDTVTTTETSGTTATVKGTYTITTRFCSRPASNLLAETVIHAVVSIKDSNIKIGEEIPFNSYAAINTCCMDASDNGVIAYTLGGVALPSSKFGYFFISDTNSARMYFYDTVAKKTTSKVFRKLGRCVFTLFYIYKLITPTITMMVSDIQWDGKASKFVIVTSSSMLYMVSVSQNIIGATSVLYMDEDGGNVSVKQFTDTALVQLPDYRLTSVYHDGYDLWVPLDPASFGGLVVTQTPIQGSVTQHAPKNELNDSYSIDDVWLDSSDTDVVSPFGLNTQVVQFRWDQEAKKYYMNISGGVSLYCFLDASDKMENVPQITIDGNSTELVPFSCERFYLRPTLSADSNAIILADMYNTRYMTPS